MSEYEIAAGCTIAGLALIAAAALVRWLVSNPRYPREPLSEDGYWPLGELPDFLNPDTTIGAEKIANYRRTGVL